jgi:hypothetical protein
MPGITKTKKITDTNNGGVKPEKTFWDSLKFAI